MKPIHTKLIRPDIAALSSYHAPLPPDGIIKLDAMENPYPWPDEMLAEWRAECTNIAVNFYPDAGAGALKLALREAMQIPDNLALLLGNGSDEIIQIIALALAQPGAKLLAPCPTFVMYKIVACYAGLDFIEVPLAADFKLDMPAMRQAIQRQRPELVFIASPNNPTGNAFDAADLEEIIQIAQGLVVIDEAYQPFSKFSVLPLLQRYPNLLLMRTVSKMGLAGLRLGYLIGATDWLEQLEKLRMPYNINALSQAACAFALRRKTVFEQQIVRICEQRRRIYTFFSTIPWMHPYPSDANFILVRIEGDADHLSDHLKQQGIWVKNLNGATGTGLPVHCLRITVGSETQNSALIAALEMYQTNTL